MPFVISMGGRHLDNTTLFMFPKRVILKRENITMIPLKWAVHFPKFWTSTGYFSNWTSSSVTLSIPQLRPWRSECLYSPPDTHSKVTTKEVTLKQSKLSGETIQAAKLEAWKSATTQSNDSNLVTKVRTKRSPARCAPGLGGRWNSVTLDNLKVSMLCIIIVSNVQSPPFKMFPKRVIWQRSWGDLPVWLQRLILEKPLISLDIIIQWEIQINKTMVKRSKYGIFLEASLFGPSGSSGMTKFSIGNIGMNLRWKCEFGTNSLFTASLLANQD